jgi:hypothetical protein
MYLCQAIKLNNLYMFTEKTTISFDPQTFGLKQLELDSEKLGKAFRQNEINLINDLSFFEETVNVPIIENGIESTDKNMVLDSFAVGMYDFIRGCKNLIALPDAEFDAVLDQVPHLKNKEFLTQRMELGKQILYKYFPECKDKLF